MKLKQEILDTQQSVEVLIELGINEFTKQDLSVLSIKSILYNKKKFDMQSKPGYVKVDDIYLPVDILDVPILQM